MLRKLWLRHWYLITLTMLLVISASLIFYKLGTVPHGMTWDEAAIGYNGFAVITTRRDEWLKKLPISFKSYGDYKAPLAIYIVGFFVTILGSELWVIRLPFAIAGIFSLLGFSLLSYELFNRYKFVKTSNFWLNPNALSIISGILLATSPWYFHFSRIGFESGISLMWTIWGCYFYYLFLRKNDFKVLIFLLFIVTFVFSLYTYHSSKLFVPLITITLVLIEKTEFFNKKNLPSIVLGIIAGLLLITPLVIDSVWGLGGSRFTQASVFGLPLSQMEKASQITHQFIIHFSPSFLVQGLTDTLRHGDGHWGVLTYLHLLLLLISLLSIIFNTSLSKKIFILIIFWLLFGIIPAAIGRDVPHSNRALLALPAFILLATIGFYQAIEWINKIRINKYIYGTHGEKNCLTLIFIGMVILLNQFCFASYLSDYFNKYLSSSDFDFKDGYMEMFNYVVQFEKGLNNYPKLDQIIISSKYGQPYIYALLVRRTNPIWYQGGSLNTYLFVDEVKTDDLLKKRTLVVATTEELDNAYIPDKTIIGSSGKPKFKIYIND